MAITLVVQATNGGKGPFTNAVPSAWTGYDGTTQPQVDDIILVWASFDNVTATTPTITSIQKASGETNNWVMLASHDSPQSGSAAGVRGELWGILVSNTGPWFSTLSIATTTASTGAAVTLCQTWRGASINLRGSAGSGASSASCSPSSGDLVIGAASSESSTAFTGDTDTTNGSWSTILARATSGGGSASNVASCMQYKVVTASGTQTFNPSAPSDGGVIAVALQPWSAPPNEGTASGSHAWTGTAESGDIAVGSATGSTSWSGTTSGTAPLTAPTFLHWFSGASTTTQGYIELHIKAETFDRTLEVQRKLWGAGDETYATVHTSGTITAGQEYVATDSVPLGDSPNYQHRVRQSVTTPTAQTSQWAAATPPGGSRAYSYHGSAWNVILNTYDGGISYDCLAGVVNIDGYDNYFIGNGRTGAEVERSYWEGRNLHMELDAVSGDETCWLDSAPSLRSTRFCQLDLDNTIYVIGPKVGASYTTAVYSFGTSLSWSTSGPALPTAQAWVAAAIGTKIYAIGANLAFRVWDTAGASSWSTLTYSGTSAPRWVGAVGGKLYVYCQDGTFKSYDPTAATWDTSLTAPSSAYLTGNLASNPIGIDDNGRLYLWGGQDGSNYSNDLWHYDVDDDAWGSDQTLGNSGGAYAVLSWSPHWEALILGSFLVNGLVGNGAPEMMRPIPPGVVTDGAATGSTTWAATASGTTARAGSATGAHSWVGAASSPSAAAGEATGATAWAGTASGAVVAGGTASAAATWVGTSVGTSAKSGAAASSAAWAGTAAGEAPIRAVISGGQVVAPANRPLRASFWGR